MKDKKLIFGIVRSKELINDLKTWSKQGYNLKSSQFLTSINALNGIINIIKILRMIKLLN